MNMTIKPQAPKLEQMPVDVEVNGKIVGDCKPSRYSDGAIRWMAALRLHENWAVYGHGDTPEKSITNAIEAGGKDAVERLRLIDEFAAAVGYRKAGES